jgi:hypothetical protein
LIISATASRQARCANSRRIMLSRRDIARA